MRIWSSLFCFIIVSCSSLKVPQNRPQYAIDESLLQEVQKKSGLTRTPASVSLMESGLSTKRIYFKTLYEQYLTYTQLSQVPSQIHHCPAFHNDFIETQSPKVVSNSARAHHKITQIEKELTELCDKGVTANYYKFENLIQYHVNKKSFHQNPASIFSLLKIPIFENMYELKSSHGLMVFHPELIEISKTHWFTSYLSEFKMEETMIVQR